MVFVLFLRSSHSDGFCFGEQIEKEEKIDLSDTQPLSSLRKPNILIYRIPSPLEKRCNFNTNAERLPFRCPSYGSPVIGWEERMRPFKSRGDQSI